MSNANNPAFPFDEKNSDGTHYHSYRGMTLRDWFAGQALGSIPLRKWDQLGDDEAIIKAWAKAAYILADEMLKERSK